MAREAEWFLLAWAAVCMLLCVGFLAGWALESCRGRRRARRRGGELPDELFRRIGRPS